MLLFLLAYLGGVLTILSPCILPVLPFVFARGDRPFLRNGLPLLAGMAITFSLVATLAAVGGGWAVAANSWGRWIALVLLAGFAMLLIFPSLADRAMRPLVGWGARLSEKTDAGGGIGSSLLLGVATGLLWAPCAGPILGIILTGAALSGASVTTAFLLLAYALGAATSLALALMIGGRVFAAMKKSIGAGEGLRKALGVLILAGVAVIALGLDTRVLSKLSTARTFGFENGLARMLGMQGKELSTKSDGGALPVEGMLPPLAGADLWINSPPLTREQLRGKVVLIDFWTYSCINCIRSIPYVKAWYDRYRDKGLVVIGVHSPEFAFERDAGNVRKAVADFGIRYPVALDNKLAIWRAFDNRYWPAHYLADAQGRIRYHHFGEGNEAETEAAIRSLLAENGATGLGGGMANVSATGAEAAGDLYNVQSPETYIGSARAESFASSRDAGGAYRLPSSLSLNQWGLAGAWGIEPQRAVLQAPGGAISFRFQARDLHLVLGSSTGKPIRFRVTLDGKAPGADHGVDVDAAGNGIVTGQRLYQLVRQHGGAGQRLFTVTFLDPGVEAYAFTFG